MLTKIKHFLLEEGKLVALVTAYFLVAFGLIGLLKKLTLAEYAIEIDAAGKAVIASLVIAKVVVVLDKTRLGNRFEGHAVWSSVLYKTLVYTLVTAVVVIGEKLFEARHAGGGVAGAWREVLAASDSDRALATVLCVSLAFVGYNFLSEVGRIVGWKRLVAFIFARHPDPPEAASAGGGGDAAG